MIENLSFKAGVSPDEYQYLHPQAKVIVTLLQQMLAAMGLKTEVTSILRKPDTIKGESGVHATLRAVDIVPRGNTVIDAKMQTIAKCLNEIFERPDGKPAVIWHLGTGYHFHIQVMATRGWIDAKGDLTEYLKAIQKK